AIRSYVQRLAEPATPIVMTSNRLAPCTAKPTALVPVRSSSLAEVGAVGGASGGGAGRRLPPFVHEAVDATAGSHPAAPVQRPAPHAVISPGPRLGPPWRLDTWKGLLLPCRRPAVEQLARCRPGGPAAWG